MECPHCQQALPATDCPACGQPALTGANYCHQCGHLLPAPEGEPPRQLTCASCQRPLLPGGAYCPHCGEPAHEHEAGEAPAEGERVACSDGNCIGIIGADGNCIECGKPYTGPPED